MKKLTIKGKEYPCHITMGAMLRFQRETGRDISEMKSGDAADLIVFIWCCTASACNSEGVEFGLSLYDFADALSPETLKEFSGGMGPDESEQKKTATGASE